jgi:hypothetical protein
MKTNFFVSLSVLSWVLVAQLVSSRGHAQEVGGEVSAAPVLGEILRDENGEVLHLNHWDAERKCHLRGGRLPTARELAEYSQGLGARGIRETSHPGMSTTDWRTVRSEIEQMGRDGYYPIYVTNRLGQQAVDFYFNYSGYQCPTNESGSFWFWSSSVRPEDTNDAYSLSSDVGVVGHVPRRYDASSSAVRCMH